MIRPITLTVLLTNWCNAECKHCCMSAGPKRNDTLSLDQIKKAVFGLHRRNPLKVVVFAGGEPMAKRNILRHAIQFCSSLGIRTRMVTNAYWAKSEKLAQQQLKQLHSDGLMELNLSCDDYHQAYVPITNVINAWKASKGIGFSAVIIANGTGPHNLINPGYLMAQLGENVPACSIHDKRFWRNQVLKQNDTYYGISYSTCQKLGRAVEKIADHIFVDMEDQTLLEGGCPHVIRDAALSPKGDLLACCGFEFMEGNPLILGDCRVENEPNMSHIADGNDFVSALAYLGPMFLTKVVEAAAPELITAKSYGSVCEICQDLTTNQKKLHVIRETSSQWQPALQAVRTQKQMTAL